jgi:RNA 2',3'-cyclic 3'-phosphodiesterase
VTLAFLGQVPQEGQEELRTRLARTAARHAPLSLRIRGTGRFGDRVLFARLAGDLEGLHRLAASVQAAVLRTSPRQEERSWRPHVTLARCAAGESGDSLRALVEQLAGYEGPEWTAERIHLVSSVPPCGPRRPPHYVDVVTWPLSRC